MRQETLDPPIDGFKVGDLVKWRKPINEYESKLVLIVTKLHKEYNTVSLSLPDKRSYYAQARPEDLKKVRKC